MSELPENLRYTSSHLWVELIGDDTVRIGITDFAQVQLGDLVYVELPIVGRTVDALEQCAVVESVKSATEIFSPFAGDVTIINDSLVNEPEQINDAPYSSWLFCLKLNDLSQLDQLLDARAYAQLIDQ